MARKAGYGKTRCTYNYREWQRKVFERDNYKCKNCGEERNLHAHHTIPWKEKEELRFDVGNGQTLCCSCHMSIEVKKRIPWNKGKKCGRAWNKGISPSDETRKKISEKLKKNPVNYWLGKKRSEEDKEKMRKAKIGKPAPWNSYPKSEETKKKISDTKRNKMKGVS